MARQYRLGGTLQWLSQSGNAIFALSNKLGSGKKIVLRSVEAQPMQVGTISAPWVQWVSGGTLHGGEVVTPVPLDTDAPAWPASVDIRTGTTTDGGGTLASRFIVDNNQRPGAALCDLSRCRPYSAYDGMIRWRRRGPTTIRQPFTVRSGERLSLRADPTAAVFFSLFLRVSLTLRVGTRWYVASALSITQIQRQCIVSIDNTGSATPVEVMDVFVEEVGDVITPYLQLVPISGIDATALDGTYARVPVTKLDTDSPDPWTWVDAAQDVPVKPYGVPEAYFAEGSAGGPKGMSYLHTKDFIGPVWRTLFPEFRVENPAAGTVTPDDRLFTRRHKGADLFVRRAGITLREGEGVALVSAAETATGSTAVGVAGINLVDVACTFDIVSDNSLTVTGLQPGSDVVVYAAGTTTILGAADANAGADWVFSFDTPEPVDVGIFKAGYLPLYVRNLSLSGGNASLPVTQVVDRAYLS